MPSLEMIYNVSKSGIITQEDISLLLLQKGYALTGSAFDANGTIKLNFWKSDDCDKVVTKRTCYEFPSGNNKRQKMSA